MTWQTRSSNGTVTGHHTADGSACPDCVSCTHCAIKGVDTCARFCAYVNSWRKPPSDAALEAALKWFDEYAPIPERDSMHAHGLVLAAAVRAMRQR